MNKVVELKGITKRFGTVTANDKIDLTLFKGEIHSLLGENGAGKSSLMNVLNGIYQPDEGEILIRGERMEIRSPRDAIKNKIGMIHQHLKLVEKHTVLENMIAGNPGGFFISKKKLTDEIRSISEHYGFELDPTSKIADLSIAEKQRVEILKVLYRGAKILIMDEPTAVLTPQETAQLFKIIRVMREEGCTIIIITHKLDEVLEISDRITILRKGKFIETVQNENLYPKDLTDMMVGKSTNLQITREKTEYKNALLKINSVNIENASGKHILKDISFEIKEGELVGVAGVAGSGQKELCESIVGLQKIDQGDIVFKNENLIGLSPRCILSKGISMSFVPEDRLGMGLVSSMDITENVLLKSYHKQKSLILDRKDSKKTAEYLVDKLNIDTPSIDTPVRKLSGGNIQKVLLGREIDINPELIITAYPARGLDVGSAHLVYDLLNQQKKNGVGILFIGEDLDVLLQLCDKIIVMYDGKITGIVNSKEVTKEDLGMLMAGMTEEEVAQND